MQIYLYHQPDDVYSRTSFYDIKEKLFAADILSHKQCMNKYFLQYEQNMNRTSYHLEDVDSEFNMLFKLMVESLDLDQMATQFLNVAICIMKNLIIKFKNQKLKVCWLTTMAKNICFTYPRDRSKSQMFFFSTNIHVDVVESLHNKSSNTDIIWHYQKIAI